MLTSSTKRQIKFNQRRILVDSIKIGLASPEEIRKWAERQLPNGKKIGEVVNPETLNYNTYKPIRDGLFCERIFGPVKTLFCACGKKQNKKTKFCPECEVENTPSDVRRFQLGFIELFSPVTHIWYLKGRPSYIAHFLKKKRKSIEDLAYCKTFIPEYTKNFSASVPNLTEKTETFYYPKNYYQAQTLPVAGTFACVAKERELFLDFITISPPLNDIPITKYAGITRNQPIKTFYDLFVSHLVLRQPMSRDETTQQLLSYTGGEAIRHLISKYDLPKLVEFIAYDMNELELEINELENIKKTRISQSRRLGKLFKKRAGYIRRLKLAQLFFRSKKKPEWMILSTLPVLPPDLRPIIKLEGGITVVSDLNKLYRRVIFANKGLQKVPHLNMITIGFAKRSLQEAVDALLDNGKGGAIPYMDENTGHPLKSLAEILKGKKGRFRQNLLGKRVDYSGRSVIIVGPKLKLHQCGLPKEMAIVLFQPFLIRELKLRDIVLSQSTAKSFLQHNRPVIWDVLQQLIKQHPVLLNRAPTLHRLGIQAFQPILVQGSAILLHPLVCTAFNADFDGDQMAVHIPLSYQARGEAWKLLWSRNNLLSPATGQPVLVPSQDMVLGCYYLTTFLLKRKTKNSFYFADLNDALMAYNQNYITLHQPLWVRLAATIENSSEFENPLEFRINSYGKVFILFVQRKINYFKPNPPILSSWMWENLA